MIIFHDALQCWRKQPEHSNPNSLLNDFWIFPSIPAVLEYPHSQNGRLTKESFTLLEEVCHSLAESEFALPVAKGYLNHLGIEDVYAKQLVNLTRAILNGVCAAYHLSDWTPESGRAFPEDAINSLKDCFKYYHQEWNLLSRPVSKKRDHAEAIPSLDRASAALDLLSDSFEGEIPVWWTESNWLLVRRLLSYLLGDPELHQIAEENEVQMLVVNSIDEGLLAPVTTTALAEGRPAAYLDPVALGVTLFDDEMLDSLRIAARICRPALSEKSLAALAEEKPEVSVRIGPQPGMRGLALLTGGSAGGITTLAAYATAQGQRLNRDHTASFTVTAKDPKLLDIVKYELSLSDVILGSVDSESIEIKLNGKLFSKCKPDPLTTVFLHATQNNASSGKDVSWEKWVPRVEQREEIKIKPILANQTLSAVLHQITGDERIEGDLRRYCDKMVEQWDNLTNPQQGEAELEHYISPWFSKVVSPDDEEKELSDKSERNQIEDHYQSICEATDSESVKFQSLFQPDEKHPSETRCIVVTEDAGAGKSVFSRALQRWLSTAEDGQQLLYDGKPTLVIRFERGESEWPAKQTGQSGLDTYLDQLQKQIEKTLNIEPKRAAEIVQYALRHDRIVFILDAFDQLSGKEEQGQVAAFMELVNSLREADFRIVVTSRARQVEDHRHSEGLFSWRSWSFFRLNGFTPLQQLCYLKEPIEKLFEFTVETQNDWDEYFQNINDQGELKQVKKNYYIISVVPSRVLRQIFKEVYNEVQELLMVPAILKFVRLLCRDNQHFPVFANRGDLYFQATDYLFDRNLTKDEKYRKNKADYTTWFREILSAAAYEMMTTDDQTYAVEKHRAHQLKSHTKSRITTMDIINDWNQLWDGIGRVAGLTDYLIVEDKTKDYFGFKHKGMMEFYAGLFLARNSQADWKSECQMTPKDQSCLIDNSADPNWMWVFRFALELCESEHPPAREYLESESIIPSLSALFAPKSNSSRPFNLMFHSWKILERNHENSTLRIVRDKLLQSYRMPFRELLLEANADGDPSDQAQTAAELIHEDDLIEMVGQARDFKGRKLKGTLDSLPIQDEFEDSETQAKRKEVQNQLRHLTSLLRDETLSNWIADLRPKTPAYSLCADQDDIDHLTFMMGASSLDNYSDIDEKPLQMVRLKSFYMATCCVTREQYRLFDPHLEIAYREEFDLYVPDDDCPVIRVNWLEAFFFTQWLGEKYQLPSESQWEGASWGKIDRCSESGRKTVISVPPYNESFTNFQCNYDTTYPINEKKTFNLGRTLPVRWTEERRQLAKLKKSIAAQLPAYSMNNFGLWHMNGNVNEWCLSTWEPELLANRILKIYEMVNNKNNENITLSAIMSWSEQLTFNDWYLLAEQCPFDTPEEKLAFSETDCMRSIRGGSWDNVSSSCRNSMRTGLINDGLYHNEYLRFNDLGFRVLRTM